MSSVRAIERLPPILKPFDSINGHLRLPSGNILLTAGSSRTESVSSIPLIAEGFQDQRVTFGSFYIHPVTTETQKLGHLNLAIPHLGAKLSPPDISNLCPLSGTIVVGALESNKDYRGVLQLATIRLVALE
ncbi:hypothetical protein DL93DRAFT_2075852 [Clavulina sp. PMI_390]|nr:hypothetical protein DL93DRAFT_2075852 [Clavulina sp. PMI_390]